MNRGMISERVFYWERLMAMNSEQPLFQSLDGFSYSRIYLSIINLTVISVLWNNIGRIICLCQRPIITMNSEHPLTNQDLMKDIGETTLRVIGTASIEEIKQPPFLTDETYWGELSHVKGNHRFATNQPLTAGRKYMLEGFLKDVKTDVSVVRVSRAEELMRRSP